MRRSKSLYVATVTLGCAAVLVACNALVSYRASAQAVEAAAQVRRSFERSAALEKILSDLRDAETGQRGYLITASPSYLQPYNEAALSVDKDLTALAPGAIEDDIKEHAKAKMEELARTVELRRAGKQDEAVAMVRTDYGKSEMDAVRRDIGTLQAQELSGRQRLMAVRDAAIRRMRVTFALATCGVLIVLGMLGRFAARFEGRLRGRVEAATRSLSEMVRDAETFNYSVSHDLRSPLRTIRGKLYQLRKTRCVAGDGSALELATGADADAERMDRLVGSLLTFSRVARGEIQMRACSVEAVVEDALAQVEGAEKVNVELAAGLPPVWAHPQTLSQMLVNLIQNGLKFSRDGTEARVSLRAEQLGTCVRIAVRDDGIGIPEQYQETIFEPFQRLNSGLSGSGLGLAIVKRGAERMGADLDLQSEPGAGSTFAITLPVADQSRRRA